MVSRKLRSELKEEILTRVPPQSLVRFGAVCREWNALFKERRFVNNHFACARAPSEFMLQTKSKIYSTSLNLNDNIKVRELTTSFDTHGLASFNCDGLFFFYDKSNEGATVWNPCLRQARLIDIKLNQWRLYIIGMGYDNSRPERRYKIVGYTSNLRMAIYEFATNAWKFVDDNLYHEGMFTIQTDYNLKTHQCVPEWKQYKGTLSYNNVSLNVNLYWTDYNLIVH
ncbi:hypothetical protein EUTSA_v10024060mg [Eutrema salsugineum]|uniref:F-box domain-containing protein n=1 Tax=Eutrema salsugineum TaxID=72664 RepID=V4JW34_EUTSA|nr:hypothetical protein EUTSA_v10024060mg [Eutrema salsugineum]